MAEPAGRGKRLRFSSNTLRLSTKFDGQSLLIQVGLTMATLGMPIFLVKCRESRTFPLRRSRASGSVLV